MSSGRTDLRHGRHAVGAIKRAVQEDLGIQAVLVCGRFA